MYDKTENFIKTYGTNKLSEIIECAITMIKKSSEFGIEGDVHFTNIHRMDSINALVIGFFFYDDKEQWFRIEFGDVLGTCVHDFGENTDITPPETQWRTLCPNNHDVDRLGLRKRKSFQELEEKYNYDMFMQPSIATISYYENLVKDYIRGSTCNQ